MTAEDWKRKSVCSHVSGHGVQDVTLIAETYLEVLSNLTNETLEGQLADQELSRLLVTPSRKGYA